MADIEIEVLDSSAVVDVTDVKGEELEEGVARGDDALTLLDHVPTRNDVINELVEVSCRVAVTRANKLREYFMCHVMTSSSLL